MKNRIALATLVALALLMTCVAPALAFTQLDGPNTVETGDTVQITVTTDADGVAADIETQGLEVVSCSGGFSTNSMLIMVNGFADEVVYTCKVTAGPGQNVSFRLVDTYESISDEDIPIAVAPWTAQVAGTQEEEESVSGPVEDTSTEPDATKRPEQIDESGEVVELPSPKPEIEVEEVVTENTGDFMPQSTIVTPPDSAKPSIVTPPDSAKTSQSPQLVKEIVRKSSRPMSENKADASKSNTSATQKSAVPKSEAVDSSKSESQYSEKLPKTGDASLDLATLALIAAACVAVTVIASKQLSSNK